MPETDALPNESSPRIYRNSDSELNALTTRSLRAVGLEKLDQLMKAHQKFNEPVYIIDEETGRERRDSNFKLKKFLAELPEYFESAQKVGLSPNQAQELTLTLLKSSPYDFHQPEITVSLVARAFRNAADKKVRLETEDYEKLKKLMAISAKDGVDDSAMYSYSLAQRIGIPTRQAVGMISKLIDADGSLSGYTFGYFNDALKTLNVAKVDPGGVVKIFDKLGGERPYYHQGLFKAFRDIVTFACPGQNLTPQELIDLILKQVESGEDVEQVLGRFIENNQTKLPEGNSVEVINPREQKGRYFVRKPGELEIAALPYQTGRSLNEGLRDLEKISVAYSALWQETGEGFWIYDNQSEMWFSLGGQTELKAMAVRHNMMPYDISQLSKAPLMFHCHPREYEVMIMPPRGSNAFPDQFRDQVTSFLSATPSRADYDVVADFYERALNTMSPRSFIVHPLGVTEFIYPNDLDAIKQMSVKSRDIRDLALLDFDWKTLGVKVDDFTLIENFIKLLNKKLPEGFRVRLYPRGFYLGRETK